MKGKNGRWGLRDSKTRYWRLREKNGWNYDEMDARRPSYMNALSNRNYVLFAVLADIRNFHIKPLHFARRGVPHDVSKATLKDIPTHEEMGGYSDYHGHTWFNVQELMDTDWDAVACHETMALFADDYLEWKETGKVPPGLDHAEYTGGRSMWHKGLPEGFHRQVTEEEMTLLLLTEETKKFVRWRKNRISKQQEKLGIFCGIELPRTYRDLVSDFIETISDMVKLGPPDRVRVVIAFDN